MVWQERPFQKNLEEGHEVDLKNKLEDAKYENNLCEEKQYPLYLFFKDTI